ncbi:hypothetical protein CERZMDRAFT_88870 [Cercospora zeae-maydis SCOH1-5]|uniref:Uncharacterized protein n=1 Tax=Cercospora zeae-maydis SCOH1-5 TaxID=717836 RepID=A0A6A6F143_9PEZI|nr:hypothetical protein CERZMDRAFT_88870 [Cercospora zeae-maydis SCOH1-5]
MCVARQSSSTCDDELSSVRPWPPRHAGTIAHRCCCCCWRHIDWGVECCATAAAAGCADRTKLRPTRSSWSSVCLFQWLRMVSGTLTGREHTQAGGRNETKSSALGDPRISGAHAPSHPPPSTTSWCGGGCERSAMAHTRVHSA